MNFLHQLKQKTMDVQVSRSAYPAQVISRVTNPCILSVLVLLLIAYTEFTDVRALVVWVAIMLLFLVVMPLVYVYLRTSKSQSGRKLVANPTIFLKQHPRDVLILGLLTGLPCFVILLFLEAPPLLLCTLAALLISSVVTAIFNIFYRVSYHLAAVTILVLMAAFSWGPVFLVLLVAIPIIAWAKYHIHEHTPTQLATGIVLSLAIVGAISYLFD